MVDFTCKVVILVRPAQLALYAQLAYMRNSLIDYVNAAEAGIYHWTRLRIISESEGKNDRN